MFITTNRGQKFDKIADYVHLFEWANDAQEGHQPTIHPDRILIIQDKYQGKQLGQYLPVLAYSDDILKTKTILKEDVNYLQYEYPYLIFHNANNNQV